MPSADSRTWLWIILAVALVLRVGAAIGIQATLSGLPGRTFLIEGDANGYWHLAEDIAAGREFAIYDPPRRVLRMPGFPALLAMPIATFGTSLLPARLMLAVIGTLACGLVWCLAWTMSEVRVANIAAGLTAVSPVMIGFSPVVLSETTFAACLVASLIGMAWWVRIDGGLVRRIANPSETAIDTQDGRIGNPSYVRAASMGLVIGLLIAAACYMRPSWLLAGPFFGLGAIATSTHKGRALVMAACVMIGLIGALFPWGLRNQRVTEHFTLTTFWLGPSLYDGLNPDATGDSDMSFYDRDNLLGQGMSEYDVDWHYRRAAWDFVKQRPQQALELAFIKLRRFLKPWPNAAQFGGWGPALLTGPLFVVVMGLALRGWWATRHLAWTWALTIGPLLFFAALHMVFVSSLRYRLPAEYPLTVLAAIGWRAWHGGIDPMSRAGETGG